MLEASWKNLSRGTAAGKQKSRKEAQQTSESSNHSSQAQMPNRSKSPKHRRPSIFPKLSSFKRASLDSPRHVEEREYSREAAPSSSHVACCHATVESSTRECNDRESTYNSGYNTSHSSECLCEQYYQQNHNVNNFEANVDYLSTGSLPNSAIQWRAPDSWGYISDFEFKRDHPPPLPSFPRGETDTDYAYESAHHAPHSTASGDLMAE